MTSLNDDTDSYTPGLNATAKIFAEHGTFIRNVMLSKIEPYSQINVDDMYQDLFLSLVSRPIPPNVNNIKAYLYRAIINDIYNSIRRLKNYKKLKKKYFDYLNFSINKSDSVNASNIEERLDILFQDIEGHLSSPEIRAIKLRYKEGYNIEEVAKKMSVKKESVSRYVCIGLKKIRQYSKQVWE